MAIEQTDVVRTKLTVEGAQAYAADLGKSADSLDKLAASEGKATETTSGLGDALKALEALGVTAVFSKLAMGAYEAASKMEVLETRFSRIYGSAQAATGRIEQFHRMAREADIPMEQLAEASKQLQVFGLAALDSEHNLKLFASTAHVMQTDTAAVATQIAKISQGTYRAQTGYLIGLDPASLKARGMPEGLSVTSSDADKAAALAAAMAVLQDKFGGAAEDMAKTTKGAVDKAIGSWGKMSESIGRNFLPVAGEAAKIVEKFADAVRDLSPVSQREIALLLSLGLVTGGLATVYNTYLALKRLGIIAENTSAIATGRSTGATVAATSAMEAYAIATRTAHQSTAAYAAGQAELAVVEAKMAARMGGAAGGAGLLSRIGGIGAGIGAFASRWGPMIGGTVLATGIASGVSDIFRSRENDNQPVTQIGRGGYGEYLAQSFTQTGPIAAYAAQAEVERNQRRLEAGAKESARIQNEANAAVAADIAAKKAAAEAEYIKKVQAGVVAQREHLGILDAEAKVAAFRAEKEADVIPAIRAQLAGAQAYSAEIEKVVKLLPQTEEGKKERATLDKELLDTVVAEYGYQRQILDIQKKQNEENAKELAFMQEVRAGVVKRAADKMNEDRATGLSEMVARGTNPMSLADMQTGWQGKYLQTVDAALAARLAGKPAPEAQAAALRGLGREQETYREGVLSSQVELATTYADTAKALQVSQTVQAQYDGALMNARLALEQMYAGLSQEYGDTPTGMGYRNKLASMQAEDVKKAMKDMAHGVKEQFAESLGGKGDFAGKLVSELQQQALNAPSGLTELLPSMARLNRIRRPPGSQVILQVNLSGSREEIARRASSELTRLMDSDFTYESDTYAVGGV